MCLDGSIFSCFLQEKSSLPYSWSDDEGPRSWEGSGQVAAFYNTLEFVKELVKTIGTDKVLLKA